MELAPDRDYGHGIIAIDSGYARPQADAIHLIIENGRAAVVDTGTSHSVPHVLAALERRGLAPSALDFVLLTHVHLDHAGGAGALLQACPGAKLVVHPRGVRHMVNPGALIDATVAVYGAQLTARLYGDVVRVDPERILEARENQPVELAGRRLSFLETPGHARHHVAILDERTGHCFAGDVFGVSYRELDRDGRAFVFPATTPSQFDPDAQKESIIRILERAPSALYLTHYGQVREVPRLAADLVRLVAAHAEIGRDLGRGVAPHLLVGELEAALTALMEREAAEQGWALSGAALYALMRPDLRLNAAGVAHWMSTQS